MLFITKGYSATETSDATERAAALAEKSGDLRQLVNLVIARGVNSTISGDVCAASALADRALELALREGGHSSLGRAHMLQLMAHFYRGDLVGGEEHFIAGLQFFDHPSFRRVPAVAVAAFNYGSWSAWMLGRTDAARARMARMLAAVNSENPYEGAFAGHFATQLQGWMGEHEQAEATADRGLEISEKNNFRISQESVDCLLVRPACNSAMRPKVLV
jgi:hypothetical protein